VFAGRFSEGVSRPVLCYGDVFLKLSCNVTGLSHAPAKRIKTTAYKQAKVNSQNLTTIAIGVAHRQPHSAAS